MTVPNKDYIIFLQVRLTEVGQMKPRDDLLNSDLSLSLGVRSPNPSNNEGL